MLHVSLDEAATRLAELVAEVANGETVVITKDGEVVAQLLAPASPTVHQDGLLKAAQSRPMQDEATKEAELEARRRHVEYLAERLKGMPLQEESAGDFVRRMRDEDRY